MRPQGGRGEGGYLPVLQDFRPLLQHLAAAGPTKYPQWADFCLPVRRWKSAWGADLPEPEAAPTIKVPCVPPGLVPECPPPGEVANEAPVVADSGGSGVVRGDRGHRWAPGSRPGAVRRARVVQRSTVSRARPPPRVVHGT